MTHISVVIAFLMTVTSPVAAQSMYTIGDLKGFCQHQEKKQQGLDFNEVAWAACVGFIQGYRASLYTTCGAINYVRKSINTIMLCQMSCLN